MNPNAFPAATPRLSSKLDPLAKLKIVPVDDGPQTVVAQFNPKEVQIDKSVGWQDCPTKNGSIGLEYTGGKGARSISIELLFDRTEEKGASVREDLDALHALTMNVGSGAAVKRPPLVLVLWGDSMDHSIPNFPAVIESLSVKFQMFSSDGRVVRATATVKLKEAGTIKEGDEKKKKKH